MLVQDLRRHLPVGAIKGSLTDHEERRHDPVHDDAEPDLDPQSSMSECVVQRLVLDLTQDWIHHDQQANSYANVSQLLQSP